MTRPLDTTRISSVLVRATNWIGDAVMTTPALGAIRKSFPLARITVLATPLVAELLALHDSVDEVLVYDRKGAHAGVRGKLRLASLLRAKRFDLAILLQDAFDAALIAWLAGIPRRMGNRSDGRAMLLTHPIPYRKHAADSHQSENYLRMLSHYGINGSGSDLLLRTSSAEDAELELTLSQRGIVPGDFLLGINPGATFGSAKRWYPERFAEVARVLAAEWGARIVITGAPAETEMARRIDEALGGECCNLAGKTSVRQLMSLTKRCNFFITNDSGPMHIAAAFRIPLVAVFGSTDHRTTYPFSENSLIVRKEMDCAPCLKRECPTDHRCMKEVTVQDVIEAAKKARQTVVAVTGINNRPRDGIK